MANGEIDWEAFDYFLGRTEKLVQVNELGISSNKSLSRVMTHPSVKDTAIYTWVKAHELEHALQLQVLADTGLSRAGKDRLGQIVSEFSTSYKVNLGNFEYLAEEGAMRVEYEFLNTIPQDEKARLIESVLAIDNCPQDEKDFVVRVLTNSALSPEEYLDLEHEALRYNKAFFGLLPDGSSIYDHKGKILFAAGTAGSAAMATAGGTIYLGVKGFCLGEDVLKHPNQTLQKFCDHYLR